MIMQLMPFIAFFAIFKSWMFLSKILFFFCFLIPSSPPSFLLQVHELDDDIGKVWIQLKSGLKLMISDDHGKLAVDSTEAGFEL
jgi:hypothetical protein